MSDERLLVARAKVQHCERLLEAYDLVLDDLSDWTESEWLYVRSRVEFMRTDIVDALAEDRHTIARLQASCSHAYEKIGEARPPFWQCVRCCLTRKEAP